MTRQYIPVEEAAKKWMKDPALHAEYDALEDEFALACALIKARGDADLTQEQVAKAWEPPRHSSRAWRAAAACHPRAR